jgi:polar amino acid transport system substrate-binding protein
MKNRFFPLLLAVALLACHAAPAPARSLREATVLYFERPPYYFTSQGQPGGFLLAIARNAFSAAGLEVGYESAPPKRIMARMREGGRLCSVGWFKVPEREDFALFSVPIYRGQPLVLVAAWRDRARLEGKATLEEVFAEPGLVWGVPGGYAYGAVIDGLRARLAPQVADAPTALDQMLAMLAVGRFDYLLLAPEELPLLDPSGEIGEDRERPWPGQNGAERHGDFLVLPLADLPDGPARHIMCTPDVGREFMERLDRGILSTVGPLRP